MPTSIIDQVEFFENLEKKLQGYKVIEFRDIQNNEEIYCIDFGIKQVPLACRITEDRISVAFPNFDNIIRMESEFYKYDENHPDLIMQTIMQTLKSLIYLIGNDTANLFFDLIKKIRD